MGAHIFQVEHGRPNKLLIYCAAVTIVRYVALGTCKTFEKFGFQGATKKVVGQLKNSSRILYDLNRLNPGDLVKKPTATRVHEHCVALQFHELQDLDLVLGVEWSGSHVGS